MNSPPRVSVLMLTYNHERYIEQAVRSVLMQKTDFDYEIVIGEDCSTDRTREILLRLDAEHPGRLRLLLRERNLGPGRNFRDAYRACRGEYTAFLEGDDLWTDPLKLRKQVEVLDADRGCAICYHPVRCVDEAGVPTGRLFPEPLPPCRSTIEDLFLTSHIQIASAMLRRSAVEELPAFMESQSIGDWPLFLLAADTGHVVRLNGSMSDYRIHPGGTWTSRPLIRKHQATIKVLRALSNHFGDKYQRQLSFLLGHFHCELAREVARAGSGKAATHLARALKYELRQTNGESLAVNLRRAAGRLADRLSGEAVLPPAGTDLRAELAAVRAELAAVRAELVAVRASRTWRYSQAVVRVLLRPLQYLLGHLLGRTGAAGTSS